MVLNMDMSIMNILIVEDDIEINNLISEALKKENYNIVQVYDGKEALEKYNKKIDLVILDLMLPHIDGIEVLRKIREKSRIPIIILSSKDDETDKIVGLSIGADDYMVKPFSVRELCARVKAQLRRFADYNRCEREEDMLIHKNLKIDVLNHMVLKNECEIELRPKEFEILKLLMLNPQRVFTKEQIFEYAWNEQFMGDDNTVMVHIRRLRNKIEDDSSKFIKTVWGIGYKLEE